MCKISYETVTGALREPRTSIIEQIMCVHIMYGASNTCVLFAQGATILCRAMFYGQGCTYVWSVASLVHIFTSIEIHDIRIYICAVICDTVHKHM